MLENFIIDQPIATQTLINSVKNNKLSHAYLIESNGYSKAYDFVLSFAKYLLCPNNCINNLHCENCFQCKNIDENNYIELKIINPEGQWIKKAQLEELQQMFNEKAITGNKKIYIINGADKLNNSSSNSILKFLEEPEEGIIAILLTDNINSLLETIISRCQVISLNRDKLASTSFNNYNTVARIANYLYNNESEIAEYISDEKSVNNIKNVVDFVDYYEKNHKSTIVYMNKIWHENFSDKKEIQTAYELLLLYYKDILNFLLNRDLEYYIDYIDSIKKIANLNDINKIVNKINTIMRIKELIKYNINTNLLMDKLIIELERGN